MQLDVFLRSQRYVVLSLLCGCVGGYVSPARKLVNQETDTTLASQITVSGSSAVLPMTPWPTSIPELAPGCKRGIAYDLTSLADVNVLIPGVSWFYRWSVSPNSALNANQLPPGLRFYPMIWGSRALADLPIAPLHASDALLGFNEPNFFTQANLSPTRAAQLWPQVEAAAKASGQKLVSPALNYCGGGCWETSPFAWLDKFFAACPGCHIDYIAVHWYACTLPALQNFLTQVETRYQKKVWLTEFACADAVDTSPAVQLEYMKQALPYLENDPRVARYSWFTGRWPSKPGASLLQEDGTLTPLGQFYVNFPSHCSK